MYRFFIKNKEVIQGGSYLIIGLILGLEAFNIINNIIFMKYLLFSIATYFIMLGLYFSGLYEILIEQVYTLFKNKE